MKHLTLIIAALLLYNIAFPQYPPDTFPFNNANLLREVNVTAEITVAMLADDIVADRADDFGELEFRLYALKLEKALAANDTEAASVRTMLKNTRGPASIKFRREVTVFEIENEQLKDELWNYLHYGKGDWVLFRREFNEVLEEFARDLNMLKEDVVRLSKNGPIL
jgi:hypothetical protein